MDSNGHAILKGEEYIEVQYLEKNKVKITFVTSRQTKVQAIFILKRYYAVLCN